jgi:hypothetical protein
MKIYQGRREGAATIVTVDGRRLNPRLDLHNHSPTGFEWGYSGSGPAQLALAILADHLRDDDRTLWLYQEFKRAVVARFPYQGWSLDGTQIEETLRKLAAGTANASPVAMPISDLLPQVSPPPWRLSEDGRQILAWQGAPPMKLVCIGRLHSPADAQFACHATEAFLTLLMALKLLLVKQAGSSLTPAKLDFCGTALSDAQCIEFD